MRFVQAGRKYGKKEKVKNHIIVGTVIIIKNGIEETSKHNDNSRIFGFCYH